MEIEGKVALVTGGASGIGKATAIALADAGAAVVIADIDECGGRESQRIIEDAGGRATFLKTDVTRQQDIERMIAFADETFGALHVLHNNAGINSGWPRFPAGDHDEWNRTLAINLWAVISGTEAAVPLIRRSGGGAIVNSASLAGLIAFETDPIYAATKHGVVGFTRALAFLKDEANIRVNCICPSFVDTPLPRRRLDAMSPEERAGWEAALTRVPMIDPREVADVVLEIIRDDDMAGEAIAILYGQPHRSIPSPLSIG
jgi:Dehydrogenases with different specificities (related to short-chain alcohol dehydrogenases)